jgi:hypothetical protein
LCLFVLFTLRTRISPPIRDIALYSPNARDWSGNGSVLSFLLAYAIKHSLTLSSIFPLSMPCYSPNARNWSGMAAAAEQIFVIGGSMGAKDEVATVDRFDLKTGRWGKAAAPLQTARSGHGVCGRWNHVTFGAVNHDWLMLSNTQLTHSVVCPPSFPYLTHSVVCPPSFPYLTHSVVCPPSFPYLTHSVICPPSFPYLLLF